MERIICFKIDDWEKKYIERASEITNTEYIDTNYIEMNYLVSLLEDLTTEYDKLQEEYNDLQEEYGNLEERYTDRYFGNE